MIYLLICVQVVSALTDDCVFWPTIAMTPTTILFLTSQGHAASLAASSAAPAAANIAGFACVLLATALIVAAMEKMRRR
jgi:hypothetical protein